MKISLFLFLLISFSLFLSIFIKSLKYLSFEIIFSKPEKGFYLGGRGGIFPSIIGSLLLAIFSTVLSFFISYPLCIVLNHYVSKKFSNFVRNFVDLLWGIPSIVYGIFGFSLMVFFNLKASLLAGIITLTFVIMPYSIRSIDELFNSVPFSLKEASLSLGMDKFKYSLKILSKVCFPGIIMSLLICFGRAIGDSASILFTAGFSDEIPKSFFSPTPSLPLVIFFLYSSPLEEVQGRANVASLTLIFIVLLISIIVRKIGGRLNAK